MVEEKNVAAAEETSAPEVAREARPSEGRGPRGEGRDGRPPRDGRRDSRGPRGDKEKTGDDFAESVLSVRRVAKVIKGGRRFSFSALVVVGDKKGKVGIALGKSREVSSATAKALRKARKQMVEIPLYKTTIPFAVEGKHSASKVLIFSAAKGTGVIAGGAVRSVMEALGVRDVLSKVIGASNPHNAVKATMNALGQLRSAKQIANLRGKTIKEIVGSSDVSA